jgi:hypothetical protein
MFCPQVGPAERALRGVRPVRVQRAVVVAARAAPLHPGAVDSAVRAAAGGAVVHLLADCGRGVGYAAPRRSAQRARHADGQEQKKGMFSCSSSPAQFRRTPLSSEEALSFMLIVPLRSIFAGALSTFCSPHFSAQFCIHRQTARFLIKS